MIIVIFGVTGAGKTTIGRLLAAALGWTFYDADQFHSAANIQKLRHGTPLTDADRAPWLDSLRALIRNCLEAQQSAVLACSALKRAYRQHLKTSEEVKFVYLKADFRLIKERLRKRRGHFASPGLLRSQFDALEPPEGDAIEIEVDRSPEEIVERIRGELGI
jgi:gluconokinase